MSDNQNTNPKVILIPNRLTAEDRETYFHIDTLGKKITCTSFESKYFNKCLKQGWTVTVQYEYPNGTIVGMELEAPLNSLSIRNTNKKKRVLTPEQKKAAGERLRKMHESRSK